MSADFYTEDPYRAIEYIRLHLQEGYLVTACVENPDELKCFHRYKIHVYKPGEKGENDEH